MAFENAQDFAESYYLDDAENINEAESKKAFKILEHIVDKMDFYALDYKDSAFILNALSESSHPQINRLFDISFKRLTDSNPQNDEDKLHKLKILLKINNIQYPNNDFFSREENQKFTHLFNGIIFHPHSDGSNYIEKLVSQLSNDSQALRNLITISFKNSNSHSLLYEAIIKYGKEEIIEQLLNQIQFKPHTRIFFQFIKSFIETDNSHGLKLLLEKHNLLEHLSSYEILGLFLDSIEYNHIETLKFLFDQPQIIKIINNSKKEILQSALLSGNKKNIFLLLDKGIKFNSQDFFFNNHVSTNFIPLHKAIEFRKKFLNNKSEEEKSYNMRGIIELLIDMPDINVNIRNEKMETALHLAIINKDDISLELLINKKAEVNLQDDKGFTPLHHAVKTNNVEGINLLIQNGANVNIKDRDNKTPFDYALEVKNQEIIKILESQSTTNKLLNLVPSYVRNMFYSSQNIISDSKEIPNKSNTSPTNKNNNNSKEK